jgi:hypothetical protein
LVLIVKKIDPLSANKIDPSVFLFEFAISTLGRPAASDSEKKETVPFTARNLLGDGGEGFVSMSLEFEVVVEDLYHDVAALELPGE